MAEQPPTDIRDEHQGSAPAEHERIPFWQRVLDNPFLLLFIGVVVPTVIYMIWGIMELVQIPVAPP
jgi:hypothetical protein